MNVRIAVAALVLCTSSGCRQVIGIDPLQALPEEAGAEDSSIQEDGKADDVSADQLPADADSGARDSDGDAGDLDSSEPVDSGTDALDAQSDADDSSSDAADGDAGRQPELMVDESDSIHAIAVDETRLYWATKKGISASDKQTPLAQPLDLYAEPDMYAYGLAAAGGYAYWMDVGFVYRVSADTPGSHDTLCDVKALGLLDGWASFGGEWFTLTTDFVIASRPMGSAVLRVSKAGGDCQILMKPGSGFQGTITDNSYLYSGVWKNDAGGEVWRYDLNGQNQTGITPLDLAPHAMAVDGETLVWTEVPDVSISTLRKVRSDGTEGAKLLATLDGLSGRLLIDQGHALVVVRATTINAYDTIVSVDLQTGAKTTFFSCEDNAAYSIGELAQDANWVYFSHLQSDTGKVWRIPK